MSAVSLLSDYINHSDYEARLTNHVSDAVNRVQWPFYNAGIYGQVEINAAIALNDSSYFDRYMDLLQGIHNSATPLAIDSGQTLSAANGWSSPTTLYGGSKTTYYLWNNVSHLWDIQYASDVLNCLDRLWRSSVASAAQKTRAESLAEWIIYNVVERRATTNNGIGRHLNLLAEQMACNWTVPNGNPKQWDDQVFLNLICATLIDNVWVSRLSLTQPTWLGAGNNWDYELCFKWFSGTADGTNGPNYNQPIVSGTVIQDGHTFLPNSHYLWDVGHKHREPALALMMRQGDSFDTATDKNRCMRLLHAYEENVMKFIYQTDEGYARTHYYAHGETPDPAPTNPGPYKPVSWWGTFCVGNNAVKTKFQTLVDAVELSYSDPGHLDGYRNNKHYNYANLLSWIAYAETDGVTRENTIPNWGSLVDHAELEITLNEEYSLTNKPVIRVSKAGAHVTNHNASGDHAGISDSLVTILDGDTDDYSILDLDSFKIVGVGNRNPAGGGVNENVIWSDTDREYYIINASNQLTKQNFDTGEVWAVSLPISVTGSTGNGTITPQYRLYGGSKEVSPWAIVYDSVNDEHGIQSFNKTTGALGTLFWFKDLTNSEGPKAENIQSGLDGWIYKNSDVDPHVHLWTDGTEVIAIEPEDEPSALNDTSHPTYLGRTEMANWNGDLPGDPSVPEIQLWTHSTPPTATNRALSYRFPKSTLTPYFPPGTLENGIAWAHGDLFLNDDNIQQAVSHIYYTVETGAPKVGVVGMFEMFNKTFTGYLDVVVDSAADFLTWPRPSATIDYYLTHEIDTADALADLLIGVVVLGTVTTPNVPIDTEEPTEKPTEDPIGGEPETEDPDPDIITPDPLQDTLDNQLSPTVGTYDDNENTFWPNDTLAWPRLGFDRTGEHIWGDPIVFNSRIEKHKFERKASVVAGRDNQVSFDYACCVPREFKAGTVFYVEGLSDIGDDATTSQLLIVVDTQYVPDLKGFKWDRWVLLEKYKKTELALSPLQYQEVDLVYQGDPLYYGNSLEF